MYEPVKPMSNQHSVWTYSVLAVDISQLSYALRWGSDWQNSYHHRSVTELTSPDYTLDRRLGVPRVDVFCGKGPSSQHRTEPGISSS